VPTIEELHVENPRYILKSYKRGEREGKRNELSFDLVTLKVYGNVIACESIHSDGNLIVFDGYDEVIQSDLWIVNESKPPYVYEDVSVMRGEDYDEAHRNFLYVRPKEQPIRVNRREAYRVSVGVRCEVQLPGAKSSVPAILHDVSMTGFGIDFKKEDIPKKLVGKNIMLSFVDNSISDETVEIEGKCIRKHDAGNLWNTGYIIERDTIGYHNYVMKKQASKSRA